MEYRKLGNTGIEVSEIAFGAEFLVQRPYEDTEELIKACEDNGINFVDCWMSEPDVRSHLGRAIKGNRENWVIQGHLGSTWQNEQYVRTREMDKVIPAFEDFMERFQIDTLDFGMIHYVEVDFVAKKDDFDAENAEHLYQVKLQKALEKELEQESKKKTK